MWEVKKKEFKTRYTYEYCNELMKNGATRNTIWTLMVMESFIKAKDNDTDPERKARRNALSEKEKAHWASTYAVEEMWCKPF